MEDVKLKAFLDISSGRGYGSGYGRGDGSGYGRGDGRGDGSGYGRGDGRGDGSGDGSGDGWGDGWGDGSGYGSGDGSGDGLKSINGLSINRIDGVATIIKTIHGNVAAGWIVQGDLTLKECFVVKQNNLFAHGATLREAMDALRKKLFQGMPVEERIELFVQEHEAGKLYSNMDFFDWHNRLTGSCEMGRKSFAADNGIDLEGQSTVEEFIELTENAYGGDVIKQLKKFYEVADD